MVWFSERRPCVLVYLRNHLVPFPKPHALLSAAFAGLLGLLLFLVFERSVDWFNRWIYTHWLFSYEFGLIKRGLVGEALLRLGITPSYHGLYEVARWNLHIISALIALMLLIPAVRHRLSLGWVLFAAVLVTSPAVLQQMALGVGRLNLVALVPMLIYLIVLPHLRRGLSFAFLVVVGCVSVAIHEASLLLHLPLLLAAFVYMHRGRPHTLAWAVVAGLIFTAVAVLLNAATARLPMSEPEYLAHLHSTYSHVHHVAVKVLFSGLRENIDSTLARLLTVSSLLHHAIYLGVLLPMCVLLWQSLRDVWQVLRAEEQGLVPRALLFLACLSPLAMYPLGHDHYRWLSTMFINCFLLLLLLGRDHAVYQIVSARFRNGWGWAVLAMVIGWVAGPAGDYFSFPWARQWVG